MTHGRLHGLVDGIFAIVMTLLVLELKVPALAVKNNHALWHALAQEGSIFISYLMSFILLYIYWRAHNFIISNLAKSLDMTLINLNMLFLVLIGLVPFSTHLLGSYPNLQLAIIIYAFNIILIGLSVFSMRLYIDRSEAIESERRARPQLINAFIRMLTPVVCGTLAILISFSSTRLAFAVLLVGVLFNLPNNSADNFRKVFRIQ